MATAFAVAGLGFDRITLPEVVFSLGRIFLAEYGTPSTEQVPRAVEKHICSADALLLANHGALTVGPNIMDAYYKMETLEHFASISIYARILGGEKVLDDKQAEELYRVRSEVYGKSSLKCTGCGECSSDAGTKGTAASACITSKPVCGAKESDEADLRNVIKKMVLNELQKLG